jgi:hypothetical protein
MIRRLWNWIGTAFCYARDYGGQYATGSADKAAAQTASFWMALACNARKSCHGEGCHLCIPFEKCYVCDEWVWMRSEGNICLRCDAELEAEFKAEPIIVARPIGRAQ